MTVTVAEKLKDVMQENGTTGCFARGGSKANPRRKHSGLLFRQGPELRVESGFGMCQLN
jgi:hypothetical protein